MNIMLIGGNGFIGEHLTKKISETDKVNIIVAGHNKKSSNLLFDNVEYKNLDLDIVTQEYENLIQQTDLVVILTYPNKKIIENFCAVAAKSTRLKRIFYVSTMLVYPSFDSPQDENVKPQPQSDYEKAKYEEENVLSDFALSTHKKILIARLGNVYGGIKNKGIINNILVSLLQKKTIYISGKGEQKRDFVFVDNVVDILTDLIFDEQKENKEIFNICTGTAYSVNQLISEIESVLNQKIAYEYASIDTGKSVVIGNNNKVLSFMPKDYYFTNLSEGLKQTIKRYGFGS